MSGQFPPVGLVPAAGRASRLGQLPCSKELLPVICDERGPRPVAHFVLTGLRRAGVTSAVVAITPDKTDLLRGLGAGGGDMPRLSYVPVERTRGTAETLASLAPYAETRAVLTGFPDLMLQPDDVFARLRAAMDAGGDCHLGLFPTTRLDKFDMVAVGDDGRVTEVHPKPGQGPWRLAWLIAGWTDRFTAFLLDWMTAPPAGELHLGYAIGDAIHAGLDVRGVEMPDVVFRDVGTLEDLREAMREGWRDQPPDGRPSPMA